MGTGKTTPHVPGQIDADKPADASKTPTLDDSTQQPTRYVTPFRDAPSTYRDHSVTSPQKKPLSASQMAAAAGPAVTLAIEGIHGRLDSADMQEGAMTIRLSHVSASMRAIVQFANTVGLDVELTIRPSSK